jgi:hypothetical protein
MRIALVVFTLIASACLVSTANAAEPEGAGALLGIWQYDGTKSSFRGAIPYQSATYTFKNAADGVHVVAHIIEGRNQALHFEYLDRFDGTFVPVTGNPFYDSESTVWKDAHTAERTERRDGQVTGTTVMTVSEDGRTFTATASRTLPNGRIYTSTIVWNRIDP